MATLCRTLLPIPDGSLHSLTGEVPAEAVVTWVRALAPEDFNVSGCELLGVATSGEATLLAIEISHHFSSLSVEELLKVFGVVVLGDNGTTRTHRQSRCLLAGWASSGFGSGWPA